MNPNLIFRKSVTLESVVIGNIEKVNYGRKKIKQNANDSTIPKI